MPQKLYLQSTGGNSAHSSISSSKQLDRSHFIIASLNTEPRFLSELFCSIPMSKFSGTEYADITNDKQHAAELQQKWNRRFVRNHLLISTLQQSQYFCMHRKHQVHNEVNKHAYWPTPSLKSSHFHFSWLLQISPIYLKDYFSIFISK